MTSEWVLWLPFGLAVVAGGVAARRLWGKLRNTMGLPSWDFSRSWASNITVVGSLVSLTVLASIPVPKEIQIPRSAYTILSLVFTLLAALAPLVYNFSRKVSREGDKIIACGTVFMFVVAGTITLWAAVGQLEMQALLLEELRSAGLLAVSICRLLQVLFAGVAVGLLVYGTRTMIFSVTIQPAAAPPSRPTALRLGETHERRWALL